MLVEILKEIQKTYDDFAIVARRQPNRDKYDEGFERAMRLASAYIDVYISERIKPNE